MQETQSYKHLFSKQILKKELRKQTLGEQHFVTIQFVFDNPQYTCVKCGLKTNNQKLLLGKECKINYRGSFN